MLLFCSSCAYTVNIDRDLDGRVVRVESIGTKTDVSLDNGTVTEVLTIYDNLISLQGIRDLFVAILNGVSKAAGGI